MPTDRREQAVRISQEMHDLFSNNPDTLSDDEIDGLVAELLLPIITTDLGVADEIAFTTVSDQQAEEEHFVISGLRHHEDSEE